MLKVKVCCGTSCYIMGASELINSSYKDDPRVDIEGSTCMNRCKGTGKRPPFVTINGTEYSQITLEEFESIIKADLDAI